MDGSTWQLAKPWRGDRRPRADALGGRHGYLTLVTSERAIFHDVTGRVARFTRLPPDLSHRSCD